MFFFRQLNMHKIVQMIFVKVNLSQGIDAVQSLLDEFTEDGEWDIVAVDVRDMITSYPYDLDQGWNVTYPLVGSIRTNTNAIY